MGNGVSLNARGDKNPCWRGGKTGAVKCLFCSTAFEADARHRKFCSYKCSGLFRAACVGTVYYWRHGQYIECKTCGKKFYAEEKSISSGKKKYCSVACNPNTIKKGQYSKEKHPMWRGEARSEDVRDRESDACKSWRREVMERDKFKCQDCGCGGTMSAHHIKRFRDFKELRFDVSNGITLCWPCHSKVNGNEKKHEARFAAMVASKTACV